MIWTSFGLTMIFVAIGYLIGSISWAIIISKLFNKEDIRTKGSGNAGATNTLRNYGIKVGLTVFLLDILKPILAIVIALMVKRHGGTLWSGILVEGAGAGAIIGHIFPIFFKFKGGKGAACFVGFFISMQWILALIGVVLCIAIVAKTRQVALGSILTPFLLIIIQIILGATNSLQGDIWRPMMHDLWWVNTIFIVSIWLIVVWKHSENIKRMINGTERKLGEPK